MNKIGQILRSSPLLWSPTDLQLVNAFFKQHRAALDLVRLDHTIKRRLLTRQSNAKGKQHNSKPAPLKMKAMKAKKPKRAKAKLIDALDLDDLIATARGADK